METSLAYENCVFGKAHRAKFPKGEHRSRCFLEYVHSKLWGSAYVLPLSEGRYFMTLIDDMQGKCGFMF